jgi:hypothetical protein
MDLGRMRDIETKELARLHANAPGMMELAKVHGHMLCTGKMARETQLGNAAGSGLGALARLPGIGPDSVVEELETLPGIGRGFVWGAPARLPGIDLVFVVGVLETLLWRSCGVVRKVQATHGEAGIGTELGVR